MTQQENSANSSLDPEGGEYTPEQKTLSRLTPPDRPPQTLHLKGIYV